MERQTRQLLSLLGDDLTDSIVGELGSGEVLEIDLRRRVPGSRQTVGRRLNELERWGIVAGTRRATQRTGPPTTGWRITDDWVREFASIVESKVLDLIERQADRQREAMKEQARARTHLVSGESAAESSSR